MTPTATTLEPLRWNRANHARLEEFAGCRPNGGLAVFDWDDTCIFGDSADHFFRHQLFHLDIRFGPDEMEAVIPDRVGGIAEVLMDGRRLSIPRLKERILRAFRGIEARGRDMESLHADPCYRDFVVTFLCLFTGMETTEGTDLAYLYRWLVGFRRGYSVEEVRSTAARIFAEKIQTPVGIREWGDSRGDLTIRWNEGMRVYPEIRNLMQYLRERGFRIAVVTANCPHVVRAIIDAAGYPVDDVVGMASVLHGGRISGTFGEDFPVPFGPGKVEGIRTFLREAPSFVAGDGDGDVEMLTAFPETGIRLIIRRPNQRKMRRLYEGRARGNGFLLQDVDRALGRFAG